AIVASGPDAKLMDKPGGIFIRRTDQMPEEDRTLMLAAAAVVLTDTAGTLAQQLEFRRSDGENSAPKLVPVSLPLKQSPSGNIQRTDLGFFNGIGGFTGDAREYVMTLGIGRTPPAPWCNVISGRQLGTVVSESGGMYTWVGNAHEYRLTPWYDDPVSDTSG
ncbi:putative carbohydrate binding domain protein, partial [mine drainage metagenome]